jgi:hypothetical protein
MALKGSIQSSITNAYSGRLAPHAEAPQRYANFARQTRTCLDIGYGDHVDLESLGCLVVLVVVVAFLVMMFKPDPKPSPRQYLSIDEVLDLAGRWEAIAEGDPSKTRLLVDMEQKKFKDEHFHYERIKHIQWEGRLIEVGERLALRSDPGALLANDDRIQAHVRCPLPLPIGGRSEIDIIVGSRSIGHSDSESAAENSYRERLSRLRKGQSVWVRASTLGNESLLYIKNGRVFLDGYVTAKDDSGA